MRVVSQFVEKNRDELSTDILQLLSEISGFGELKSLAKQDIEKQADEAAAKEVRAR